MASGIATLFNSIANDYDKFNHILSLNIDKIWRKKSLVGHIDQSIDSVLDIACGTGDFAISLVKAGAHKVHGVDISEKMVEVGRQKINRMGLAQRIDLQIADCAALPFPDNMFDAVTVAFGVRNFEHRTESLKEMYRVLNSGSELILLEFSKPQHSLIKHLYGFYFRHILPTVGGWISGDRAPYEYLPRSVYAFPDVADFVAELQGAGWTDVRTKSFTFGIATVYYGKKL